MKKLLFIILALAMAYSDCIGQTAQKSSFYYFRGKKIDLKKVEGYVYATTHDSTLFNGMKYTTSVEVNNRTYGGKLKKNMLNRRLGTFAMNQDDIQTSPCYAIDNDTLGLSNMFYVKLRNLNDSLKLKEYTSLYRVKIIQQNKYLPLWFMMSCTDESSMNSMEMANLFWESGLFQSAEPEFIDRLHNCCVNDPRFNKQWNLYNTGQNNGVAGVDIQMCDAWDISTGKDVIVGILDRGIAAHRDLPDLYPLSHDCTTGGNKIVREEHGTAVAGVVGAIRNNGFGNAGVAPDCRMMDVSIENGKENDAYRGANAILWAMNHGAQVLNCSWRLSGESELFEDAVATAISKGRNGLGCVIVFASGNRARSSVEYPSSLPGVISVGAIDRGGYRSGCRAYLPRGCEFWDEVAAPSDSLFASSYGTNLHVVAPGTFVPSLYYKENIFYWGCGTSFAAPHVTGIAALMLAVNPKLTFEEVRTIICATCTKLPEYSFSSSSLHPHGTWNREVGYGLVNAYKAVELARFKLKGTLENVNTYNYKISYLPHNARIEWSCSNDFVVTQQSDSTINFVAKDFGKSTVLKAKVYCGNILIKEFTKNVSSPTLAVEGSGHISCCGLKAHRIGYLPYGATFSWNVSDNVDIDSQKGDSIRVSTVKGTSSGYWIEAVVHANGKTYAKRKTLLLREKEKVDMEFLSDSRGPNGSKRFAIYADPIDNNGRSMRDIPEETIVYWRCRRSPDSKTETDATLDSDDKITNSSMIPMFACQKSSSVSRDSMQIHSTTFSVTPVTPPVPPVGPPIPLNTDDIDVTTIDSPHRLKVTLPNKDYEGIVTCSIYSYCTKTTTLSYLVRQEGISTYTEDSPFIFYSTPPYKVTSGSPASDFVAVRKMATEENNTSLHEVTLLLYNDYGLVRTINGTSEEELLQMNVSDLPDGTYYLNVHTKNGVIKQVIRIEH